MNKDLTFEYIIFILMISFMIASTVYINNIFNIYVH